MSSATRVYFEKELPSPLTILKAMLIETSIRANFAIGHITNRATIEAINAEYANILMNEEIINYSLWKENYHEISFALIEERDRRYVEIVEQGYKNLNGALIYTLVCLGATRTEKVQ